VKGETILFIWVEDGMRESKQWRNIQYIPCLPLAFLPIFVKIDVVGLFIQPHGTTRMSLVKNNRSHSLNLIR
jgi:hypothetical protein